MLLSRNASVVGCSRPVAPLLLLPPVQRPCICCAKRGRPPKKTADADIDVDPETAPAAAKRKGRKKKTEVEPAPTAAEAPLTEQMQPEEHAHDRVISIEDMTTSMELDYTDDSNIIVPSYTHQAQGHESATQPPLDNYVPFSDSPGFVGSEELAAAAADAPPAFMQDIGETGPLPQQQPWQQQPQQQYEQELQQQRGQQQQQQPVGLQVVEQQQLVGPAVGSASGVDEEDEDELDGYDDPPGLFDFEAGQRFAVIEHPPERPMQSLPRHSRATSRREADYMLRYLSFLGNAEREEREEQYKERALSYHLQQVKESHNVYITGKALSVVMAEIELEDTQTGNRTDSFYPIWARAEHRWYPSGRFAAYNEYVKDNLADLTVKPAPGADQAEDFDIMDDVLLMADDPSTPAGDDDEDESSGNPAAGLSIDSFLGAAMLPGAGSSDLGQAYLDDVLAPAGDEEIEAELME